MKPEFKEHIRNIIGKLTADENVEYNDKVCFLKHYSALSIEEEDIINIISSLNLECDMFYYRFNETDIQGAFCPFLSFIRELYMKYYSNEDCSKFVNDAGIYNVVEDIFTSYIKEGYCERNEDIIPREVPYERERIIESIVNIFKYISDEHKMVIVLDRLQWAQQSTLRLLLEMMKCLEIKNIVIIGAYNEAQDINSYMRASWNAMVNYIKDMEMAIDYDDNRRDIIIDDTFLPEESQIDVYFRNINDMFLCLALEQAKYYLDIIYRVIESDNLEVNDSQKINLLKLYALVTIYNGEEKVAYVYCKKMFDMEYIQHDKMSLFYYYYISALINQQSGQRTAAHSFIDKGYRTATEIDDKKFLVKINMLKLIVILDKFPDVLLWNPDADMPEYLLKEAEENGQKLHLAYAYIFGFNMPENIEIVENNGKIGCENIEEYKKGMELAQELGNIQLQIRAWQKNAIQASTSGRFDETIYYYGECLKIMEGRDRKHEEAQIYNGIGYNFLINEKYDMAYDYFLRAVKIGIAVDTPKYILDAVYNMAVMGIIVGDYSATIKCTNITLKMMATLKIERLNVCNKTKLYGLAIFSYIKLKQVYNAKLYYDIMETAMQHILSVSNPDYSMWEDDIYLFYTVSGMLAVEEENYSEARKNYQKFKRFGKE